METESDRVLRAELAKLGRPHASNGQAQADDGEPKALSADDVAGIDDLEAAGAGVRWLWEGWLATQVVCALAAVGGMGKTRFCADLVRRIRFGLPWPDGQKMTLPPDGKALWVVSDNHHDQMVTICKNWDIKPNVKVNSWKGDPYEGTSLENEDDYRALDLRVQLVKPLLVIIDTVGNATDKSLSRQEEARAFYMPLQTLARKRKCCVLALTHLNATGQVLGRRATEKVRVLKILDRPDPNDKRLRLLVQKTFDKIPDALGVTLTDGGYEYDTTPPAAPEPSEPGQAGYGVQPAAKKGPGRPAGPAAGWLAGRLKDGPARVSVVRREAERREPPISVGALYKARDAVAEEYDEDGYQWWRLRGPKLAETGEEGPGWVPPAGLSEIPD